MPIIDGQHPGQSPEEIAIQRIANSLDAELAPETADVDQLRGGLGPPGDVDRDVGPETADVDQLREFVYRLLSGEFALPNKPGHGGLRQLFRSLGYQDHEITGWLMIAPSEIGRQRSKQLEHYAGWIAAILARPEPTDLSDLHAARARASVDGRLEQVREKAAERCVKEHWLGYFARAIRSGEFKSTGTNFVFRATVGGKLYRTDGTMDPTHVSLLTRTILFAILETPRGYPLYWQTAADPQYRNIYEDNVFDRLPVERKKGTEARRERELLDDEALHRLLGTNDSMAAMLEATAARLFLVCRQCGKFVTASSNSKQSRCVAGRCTWDPILVRENELVEYELADDHVRVKVCRGHAHIWPACGPSRCPVAGCGSLPMPYHKKVSVDLPVTYPRNVDYETFLRDFGV
jgi:hypothetical protein